MHGFGAMISFELQDGLDPKQFVEQLHVITLAESLGALESLIEIPALMTHGSIPRDIRLKNGIKDELIRLSVGVEDQKDLLADLESGFNELKRSEEKYFRQQGPFSSVIAHSLLEVLLTYPGIRVLFWYRIAHFIAFHRLTL